MDRGPARPIKLGMLGHTPARPITFSNYSARPGPARPGPQFWDRPGPDNRPMTIPGFHPGVVMARAYSRSIGHSYKRRTELKTFRARVWICFLILRRMGESKNQAPSLPRVR